MTKAARLKQIEGQLEQVLGAVTERRSVHLDPRFLDCDRPAFSLRITSQDVTSNLSVAYAAVALRSQLLAGAELAVFRRLPGGGRERVEAHPLYELLNAAANRRQSAYEARELLYRSLDLAGNGYARLSRDGRGVITEITPAPPHTVTVEHLRSDRLRYRFSEPNRPVVTLLEGTGEVVHVRAHTTDGLIGRSPIEAARGAVRSAMHQAATYDQLMQNSLRPSAVLSHPGKLGDSARDNVKGGVERNAPGRVLVLEEGMQLQPWSFSPRDAEFLQYRQVSNEDVARIFSCPPSILGIGDRPTYGSAVEESRQLVSRCLAPFAARIEAALARDLFDDADRAQGYFLKHDLDGLQRGDMKSRFEAYRIGREIGVFSANDIRRREGEAPIEGGDTFAEPLNMGRLGGDTGEQGDEGA
jgi:HK97 family phage portal protein